MTEERIRHGYRILDREVNLPVPPTCAEQYLPQIVSALDTHHETERRARELLKQVDDHCVSNGQNPMDEAAVALYLAFRQSGEHHKPNEVAAAADVSTVTVRERYRDLQSVATT